MRQAITLLVLIAVTLTACVNTQKMINSGNYEEAIRVGVDRLRKNKNNDKEVLRLEEAFAKARQRDLDQISFLKKEDNAANSVEIFRLYENLGRRQRIVQPLLPLYAAGQRVSFTLLDIDDEIISWKQEAAGYLYRHAMQLLDRPGKLSAREAYDELAELKNLYPDFRDVDERQDEAWNRGMNWIAFKVENNSRNLIPAEFHYELRHTDLWPSTGKWYRFLGEHDPDSHSDFAVVVNLKVVDVGPEQIKEIHFEEKKDIKTGERNLVDKRGNVVTDSAGNVIKEAVTREIGAHVIETQQSKTAVLSGSVEFYDTVSNRFVRSDPFDVRAVFEHFSATYQGDGDALTDETRRKIGAGQVAFPSDLEMVMDGASYLQPILIDIIRDNTRVLEGA